MKYIRTKDGIYKIVEDLYFGRFLLSNNEVISLTDKDVKQANTIEELCDELVIKHKNEKKPRYVDMNALLKTCKDVVGVTFREHIEWLFNYYKDQLEICNLAIWTDKGLIYVAKMNEKGESELC